MIRIVYFWIFLKFYALLFEVLYVAFSLSLKFFVPCPHASLLVNLEVPSTITMQMEANVNR